MTLAEVADAAREPRPAEVDLKTRIVSLALATAYSVAAWALIAMGFSWAAQLLTSAVHS